MEREYLRTKIQEAEKLLTELYGKRVWDAAHYSDDVLGALVATVLSQNTSDLNSGRAYAALRAAFPEGWDSVRTASVSRVADAIRCGGLADKKALRIQNILQDVYEQQGQTNLDVLKTWDNEPIRHYLRSFHGVGPKTAACVLMFNLGRPVLPVDTHVHRVAMRLGLLAPKASAEDAHEHLQVLLDSDQVYSFHVHLIEHGRTLCHARRPACPQCPLFFTCDYYQSNAPLAEAA